MNIRATSFNPTELQMKRDAGCKVTSAPGHSSEQVAVQPEGGATSCFHIDRAPGIPRARRGAARRERTTPESLSALCHCVIARGRAARGAARPAFVGRGTYHNDSPCLLLYLH